MTVNLLIKPTIFQNSRDPSRRVEFHDEYKMIKPTKHTTKYIIIYCCIVSLCEIPKERHVFKKIENVYVYQMINITYCLYKIYLYSVYGL